MKIFLSDFDGTIVNEDILDVICEITNHRKDSEKLNEEIISGKKTGLDNLIKRINFLKGVSKEEIYKKLNENNYLVNGAIELFKFLKENNFITVLHTGNIEYIAEYYKDLLSIDYIICTKPSTKDKIITGININNFTDPDFKRNGCLKILNQLNIPKENIFAIGDSAVDKKVFELAAHTIAINPKGGIENYAEYVIDDNNLYRAIEFINQKINGSVED
jgi:phosphoserine phosphatase